MKRLIASILMGISLLFITTTGEIPILGKNTAEAAPAVWKKGNYYWDSSAGHYVVNSYPIESGSTLLDSGINTLTKAEKAAVIDKYGKVASGKEYKFSVVQWVTQANITSMKGSIRSVVCNGTY